jgi:uncharacterized protein (TIRG00374 family)
VKKIQLVFARIGTFFSQSKGTVGRKNRYLVWIAYFIAALFLFIALRGMDWNASLRTITEGRYEILPVIFLWGAATFFIRALRWKILLPSEKKIGIPQVFWADMVGYFGNNILPARAGEVLRAIYLGKETRISSSFVFATCLVERFMDVIALVIIGSVSIFVIGNIPIPILNAIKIMTILGGVGLLGMFLLPLIKNALFRLTTKLPLSDKLKALLIEFVDKFTNGLRSINNVKKLLGFIGFTCLIWLMDGVGMMMYGYMFRLELSLPISFILLAGLGLSSAIPSTPGYIGVYQLAAVMILTPFGFNQGSVIVFITASQVIGFIMTAIWGGIGLIRYTLKVQK